MWLAEPIRFDRHPHRNGQQNITKLIAVQRWPFGKETIESPFVVGQIQLQAGLLCDV